MDPAFKRGDVIVHDWVPWRVDEVLEPSRPSEERIYTLRGETALNDAQMFVLAASSEVFRSATSQEDSTTVAAPGDVLVKDAIGSMVSGKVATIARNAVAWRVRSVSPPWLGLERLYGLRGEMMLGERELRMFARAR